MDRNKYTYTHQQPRWTFQANYLRQIPKTKLHTNKAKNLDSSVRHDISTESSMINSNQFLVVSTQGNRKVKAVFEMCIILVYKLSIIKYLTWVNKMQAHVFSDARTRTCQANLRSTATEATTMWQIVKGRSVTKRLFVKVTHWDT